MAVPRKREGRSATKSNRTGVDGALQTPSGRIEQVGATVLGNAVPIGLFALSLIGPQRVENAPVWSCSF